MFSFSGILSDLHAAIAVVAARDRRLTVLLVALCGRIGRMGTRLERLIRLWRAGKLPKPRAPRVPPTEQRSAPRATPRFRFPTSRGWLRCALGYQVGACGSQLTHLLTEVECQAFLAAVPQAGRILRPLLRMLTFDPPPEIVRRVKPLVAAPAAALERVGVVVSPISHFLDV